MLTNHYFVSINTGMDSIMSNIMSAIRQQRSETLRVRPGPDGQALQATCRDGTRRSDEHAGYVRTANLEHFHKCCSAAATGESKAVFLTFDFVSAQSQGFQTCSFAKASSKVKNPRSATLHHFCQCSNFEHAALDVAFNHDHLSGVLGGFTGCSRSLTALDRQSGHMPWVVRVANLELK